MTAGMASLMLGGGFCGFGYSGGLGIYITLFSKEVVEI